jgi:AcrR family transcriptional regulator
MDHSSSTQSLPDRLLRAAIDEFGRRGVEGASTRAIAAAAGTTMSMITYHHGSKEGLYLAAARRIAGEIGERITPALAAAEAGDGEDPPAALARLLALVDEFVGVMVCPESEAWARFIVREQMDPTPAFDILYGGVMGRLVEHMSALVGRASGGRIGAAEARLRTLAIVGQALVFRFARATVLRATGWTGIDEDEAAAIRRVVRAHTTAILANADGHTQA